MPQSMTYASNDALIETASEIFLSAVQAVIPGINNDEEQICGEDQDAISHWLFNTQYITSPFAESTLSAPSANYHQITQAVDKAISDIRSYVETVRPDIVISEPPARVIKDLVWCAKMMQFYSTPAENKNYNALLERLNGKSS